MRSEAWRAAAATHNRRLGRHGTPPARHYDLAARSSLDGSGVNAGEGSAGPEPKIATVERREAGVPRYGTQGASLGAWPAALRAGPTGASQAPDDSRRSAIPSLGCVKRQSKTRARKRAAGTKRCCLVRTLSVRHSGRAAIAARAGIHNHRPWVWIPGSQASPAPRNDAEKMRPGPLRFAGRGSPLSARQKQTKWIRVDRERVFGITSCVYQALAVLVLRSVHAQHGPQTCPLVHESRRMRTARRAPSCFETHRSALSLWTHRFRAAMLLVLARIGIVRAFREE